MVATTISSNTRSIVIRELCKWQEFRPVVLLVVIIYIEVLFGGLVCVVGLSIIFGVIA